MCCVRLGFTTPWCPVSSRRARLPITVIAPRRAFESAKRATLHSVTVEERRLLNGCVKAQKGHVRSLAA